MVPAFLFPENITREDGCGAEIPLASDHGKPLLLTLGITRILEQESLDVSIWGSNDGNMWQPPTPCCSICRGVVRLSTYGPSGEWLAGAAETPSRYSAFICSPSRRECEWLEQLDQNGRLIKTGD
jgi:hypothetical protein